MCRIYATRSTHKSPTEQFILVNFLVADIVDGDAMPEIEH